MDRLTLASSTIRTAGERPPSETLLAYASAYQLTLSTTLPDLGVQLHSSYLGHPDAEATSAAHLMLAPARRPSQWTVSHDPAALPVRDARRRCLLDHLAVLAEQLRANGHPDATVDVADAALDQLDTA